MCSKGSRICGGLRTPSESDLYLFLYLFVVFCSVFFVIHTFFLESPFLCAWIHCASSQARVSWRWLQFFLHPFLSWDHLHVFGCLIVNIFWLNFFPSRWILQIFGELSTFLAFMFYFVAFVFRWFSLCFVGFKSVVSL